MIQAYWGEDGGGTELTSGSPEGSGDPRCGYGGRCPGAQARRPALVGPGHPAVLAAPVLRVMGTDKIAVKAVSPLFPIASRTRNASGSCSLATSRNSSLCRRDTSCRPWRNGAPTPARIAVSTGCSMPLARPTAVAAPGRPKSPARCRDWRPEGRISSGAGMWHLLAHQRAGRVAVPLPRD